LGDINNAVEQTACT